MFNKIEKGCTIGLLSPAYIPMSDRVENGINYLKEKGYKVKKSKNFGKKYGYFAGTDQERVNDIHQLYSDDEVAFLLASRGGWGTLRLLDKLDFDLIKNNPKPFIGYSDLTTIQLAILAKTGMGTLSGPMFAVEMGKGINEFTERHFWGFIENSSSEYSINLKDTSSITMVHGKTQGKLLGGCLSLISFLLGTPYCPNFDGCIMFLEDVGEKSYKIDRYFAHLKQAGIFERISGLILGDFLDCEDEEDENGFSVQELIDQYFSNVSFPVIKNFPYGHGDVKLSMPIGATTKIDTINNRITFQNLFIK